MATLYTNLNKQTRIFCFIFFYKLLSKNPISAPCKMSLYRVLPRERENFLEIFKIQIDDIILPWVADGQGPGSLCLNTSPRQGLTRSGLFVELVN